MWGWAFGSRPAPTAARSIMRAKPAVENGDPRSLTNTKGDVKGGELASRQVGAAPKAEFEAVDHHGGLSRHLRRWHGNG